MIPSMSGREIGAELRMWASESIPGTSIVELGTWLGAGTEQLALGVEDSGKDVEIHCFDRFEVRGSEIEKAARDGVTLENKQDTLPLVKENLEKYKTKIIYHKENITNIEWDIKKPISMYVDDVCKRDRKFNHAIKTFSPAWIPGKTVIVLMDYYWSLRHLKEPDAQCQPKFMKKYGHFFHHLKDWLGLCCAAFVYLGGVET